jgi:hypothetical protein
MNMWCNKTRCWTVGVLAFFHICAFSQQVAQKDVVIDGGSHGRIFDGIGAVSAGASSRLLIDYPEPYRSQILDYLFLPGYGASLQHLKVEIGADVNSTDGSEASHMRSKDDHNYQRGYEWWLMKEARKRNPHIILDSLPWGAPEWVGSGHLYSPDMAQYVAEFLQGAKKTYDLNISYTGIWNETTFDSDYVKILRHVLDAAGLKTKVVCCDEYPRKDVDEWNILGAMEKDPQLKNAVAVVSVHYPRIDGKLTTPPAAFDLGKPLWSSEDQPASSASNILSRDWSVGGRLLAQLYNENYLKGGFTATEIWSPVTSYYDILAAPNSGLMYANTPWSGFYDVQGAIWATAHTTQFAQPGWQYLDSSSGYLPEQGDYVSLKSPNAKDWSVILETIGATHPQRVDFKLVGALREGTVHVWETNARRTFEHVSDIPINGSSFSYTFDPDSLYSLTTTTGQSKGNATPPTQHSFPFPYHESFENLPLHGIPPYLSDQDGAFEVERCAGRAGQCLGQVITEKPTPWGPLPDPWTLAGDSHWTDYEVDVDTRLDGIGNVSLMGRIDSADIFKEKKAEYPSGYIFRIDDKGAWKLLSCTYNKPVSILASGNRDFSAGRWHRFRLIFRQKEITAVLDEQPLASVQNSDHQAGMFGIGTGWNRGQFDDLTVKRSVQP